MTLVIMAAGMGSRFGGLKQIEPVGPNKEIIADFSVYDAKRAGFEKVVFIIRKEHEKYFKENIINKYKGIKVELAYQEIDREVPQNREKMLGTAHALYCAKDLIEGDFVVINSDDFYGYDSFKKAYNFLSNTEDDYVSINYPFGVTKSEFGKVKRGVVEESEGYITNIIESEIREEDGKYIARKLINNEEFLVSEDTLVAVNFFGIRYSFLDILSRELEKFKFDETNEFLLPDVLKNGIKDGRIFIKSEVSSSKWMGMTYKEDLEKVKKHINELYEKGEYQNIWK